jgi:N-acetylated-alpha-linked acidic dipeptidase
MDEARAIGELARNGWRPQRTIVFCAWDAEEPGLLGSTDWVEHHATTLAQKAVAYINTDSNSRGFLSVGGSHALETLALDAARSVRDPQTGASVYERLRSRALVDGDAAAKARARADDLRIHALGSGSDYSAFLQHLGIAALNVSFRGEGEGGEYHTLFDTYDHYVRFHDPDFAYGVALASYCGRLLLRLAEADALPFEFSRTARVVEEYVAELIEGTETLRAETEEWNELLAAGHLERATDPADGLGPPAPRARVPHLPLHRMRNATDELRRSARGFDRARERVAITALSHDALTELNDALYRSERALIAPEGLPRRPWFRHQLYAPGFYTGYGVKTLPGVREAIEERKWNEVEAQAEVLAAALERYRAAIDRATAALEPAATPTAAGGE